MSPLKQFNSFSLRVSVNHDYDVSRVETRPDFKFIGFDLLFPSKAHVLVRSINLLVFKSYVYSIKRSFIEPSNIFRRYHFLIVCFPHRLDNVYA